jgi:hypothetical protein
MYDMRMCWCPLSTGMLVIFNAFLHDYFHTPSAVPRFPSFASWVASRPELRVYLESLAKVRAPAFRVNASIKGN